MPQIERASQNDVAFFLHEECRRLVTELGRPPLAVEIGVWCGMTTLAMALGGALVVAVDTFDGRDGDCCKRAHTLGGMTFDRFLANTFTSGVAGRVLAVVGPSVEVAGRFQDGTVGMLFVDGDHRYEAIAADLATWTPKLRPGGWLYGHDAHQASVRRAVMEATGLEQVEPGFRGALQLWRARRSTLSGFGMQSNKKEA